MYYWNLVKRNYQNNSFIKIVKTFDSFAKCNAIAKKLNMFNFRKKYYYVTEFDFEWMTKFIHYFFEKIRYNYTIISI
jgi:hypothetical protein